MRVSKRNIRYMITLDEIENEEERRSFSSVELLQQDQVHHLDVALCVAESKGVLTVYISARTWWNMRVFTQSTYTHAVILL